MATIKTSKGKAKTGSAYVAQVKTEEVIAKTAVLKKADVMHKIADTGTAVSTRLAEIGGMVQQELDLLENVKLSITAKEAELQQLHNIDAKAVELADLRSEIETMRENWQRDAVEKQVQQQQDEKDLAEARRRNEESYRYTHAQQIRQDTDALIFKLQQLQRQHDEKYEADTKALQSRAEMVTAAEKELTEARTKIASYDADVEKGVNVKVSPIKGALESDYKNRIALMEKDSTIKVNEAANQLRVREAEVARLMDQNRALQAQLDKQHEQITTITQNAFNSVSGQQALAHLGVRNMNQPQEQVHTTKSGR